MTSLVWAIYTLSAEAGREMHNTKLASWLQSSLGGQQHVQAGMCCCFSGAAVLVEPQRCKTTSYKGQGDPASGRQAQGYNYTRAVTIHRLGREEQTDVTVAIVTETETQCAGS